MAERIPRCTTPGCVTDLLGEHEQFEMAAIPEDTSISSDIPQGSQVSNRSWSGSSRRWIRWGGAFACLIVIMAGLVWWQIPSEQNLRTQCRDFRKKANWKQLASLSEYWTRRQPKSAEAWLFRAEAAQGLQDFAKVADYLGRVPADDKRAIPAWLERVAILFEKLNQPLEAVATCHEILKLDPRVTVARDRIIFFEALTLQRAALMRDIRDAIKEKRESQEGYVYLVGAHWLYFSNQYELNTKWLEASPDNEMFQVSRAMQVIMSNAKDNPKRAAEFEHIPGPDELLKLYPKNIEIVVYHLERRMADGDVDGVKQLLDAVPEAGVLDARYLSVRSWWHEAQGDLKAAEEDVLRSLKIDPYGWQAYHILAGLERRKGNLREVQRLEHLYGESKKLRDVVTRMPNAKAITPELLQDIQRFAEESGDSQVATALRARLRSQ